MVMVHYVYVVITYDNVPTTTSNVAIEKGTCSKTTVDCTQQRKNEREQVFLSYFPFGEKKISFQVFKWSEMFYIQKTSICLRVH